MFARVSVLRCWISIFPFLLLVGNGAHSELSGKYESWLEEVRYIIAGSERKEFAELGSDVERDDFIVRFWQVRDPDPSTEENEFRIEHFKRIEYAEKMYREGKPGRNTERGRVYITHGPPDDSSFFVGGSRIRLSIPNATEVLSGGVTDASGSYSILLTKPEAEMWVYHRLEGALSTNGNFEIIFARVDPTRLHQMHQFLRKTQDGSEQSLPARVARDTAIMNFLSGRHVGGPYRILHAGEYKFPDLDSLYRSVFLPGQGMGFDMFDYYRAIRDLEKSPGDVLQENLLRKQKLRELVQTRVAYSQFPLSAFFGSILSDSGSTMLPITLGIGSEYEGDTLEILLELIRPDGTSAASLVDVIQIDGGRSALEGSRKSADFLYQTRLVARPGAYQLLILGRLLNREAVALLREDVNLGDYSGNDLSVSDLLFFEKVVPRKEYRDLSDPANAQFLGGSRPLFLKDFVLIPAADIRFRRGQKMTVFFEVYNPGIIEGSEEPLLQIQCRFWKGNLTVGRIPAKQLDYITDQTRDEDVVRTAYGLSIPLRSFDPGEYSFEVEVYDQVLDRLISNRTPFTVF